MRFFGCSRTPGRTRVRTKAARTAPGQLPEKDGEFQYRIKHSAERHERIARESELTETGPRSRCGSARRRAPVDLRLVKLLAASRAIVEHGGFHLPMPNDWPKRAGMVRGRCVGGGRRDVRSGDSPRGAGGCTWRADRPAECWVLARDRSRQRTPSLSVENSYSPSFWNCESVLLNRLHDSSKKSNPFADHPTYRNRHSMVNSFCHGAEGFAVGNAELAHPRSPIARLSRNSLRLFRKQPHAGLIVSPLTTVAKAPNPRRLFPKNSPNGRCPAPQASI